MAVDAAKPAATCLLWTTATIAAGCVAGCGSTENVRTDDGVMVETHGLLHSTLESMQGQPAPPLALTGWINTDGVTLDQLRGKVVLLDFWGVWCPPCRALTPELIRLHERYGDEGLVIIGVHTKQRAEDAPAYVREHEVPYIVGIDADERTVRAYHVDGYPDVYLIDRQGVLRYADVRQTPISNLETAVRTLLDEPA